MPLLPSYRTLFPHFPPLRLHSFTIFLFAVIMTTARSSPILPAHLMLKSDDDEVDEIIEPLNLENSLPDESISSRIKPHRKYSSLRPSPSEENNPIGTLVHLQGFKSQDQLPTENDLNSLKLKKILGKEFDPKFMSILQPFDSILRPNGSVVYGFKKGRPQGSMPQQIRSLRFNDEPFSNAVNQGAGGVGSSTGSARDGNSNNRIKGRSQRTAVRLFLWRFSYCPVHYKWRDLGLRFWPRWIREGNCYKGRSCSIPAGMSCSPKRSQPKSILWWHCRRKASCDWLLIKYPIVTECGCSC